MLHVIGCVFARSSRSAALLAAAAMLAAAPADAASPCGLGQGPAARFASTEAKGGDARGFLQRLHAAIPQALEGDFAPLRAAMSASRPAGATPGCSGLCQLPPHEAES